jgi:Ca2+-transporting ATPase
MSDKWHSLSVKEVEKKLKTSDKGLDPKEAGKRLSRHGPNILPEKRRATSLIIFLRQFKSVLVWILAAAVLISAAIGHTADALIILAILVANALMGFFQEYKAEKSLKALKELAVPKALVMRDGMVTEVLATDVVPGDVVVLEEGEMVPADTRLFRTVGLKMDESMLTGESVPVVKDTRAVGDVPVTERRNMVFMGTMVTYGRGLGYITGTGSGSEIGKIAEMIRETEETTPLMKKLNRFSKWLGLVIMLLAVAVFAFGFLMGGDFYEMLLVGISLAVAAVPEGLPAVITITLALGLGRMVRSKALIRKLGAVETLGATTVIAADKTGTMTTNEMTVQKAVCCRREYDVTGAGFEPKGRFMSNGSRIDARKNRTIQLMSRISALCNNSSLKPGRRWKVLGDPTEGALLVMAAKAGVKPGIKGYERIGEVPFTSERKRMTAVYKTPKGNVAYMKGAPEVVVGMCSMVYGARVSRLTPERKRRILEKVKAMAGEGMRVLALAYTDRKAKEEPEKGLVFVGLVGMIDPPKREVREAIKLCRQAGISTVMITGDHLSTAMAVGKQVGLVAGDHKQAMTGDELDDLTEKQLSSRIGGIRVFARVSPAHKVRILQALKKKGHIVAMTGDGVNDAPALKDSDIGVAMGVRGTDVARGASDMVLLDDNFASIVKAVSEGRGIYDNIRKFVRFLLSANLDEILTVSIAAFAGMPLPLLPVQILWINLLTDGLPAVALSVDPKEPDIMYRKPRSPKEGIMSGTLGFMVIAGLLAFAGTFSIFLLGMHNGIPIDKVRTMVFTAIIMFEMIYVFNCRSDTRSLFRNNPLTNKKLVAAVAASILLQLMVIYVPFLQPLFGTAALNPVDWAWVIGVSCLGFLMLPEVFIRRRKP